MEVIPSTSHPTKVLVLTHARSLASGGLLFKGTPEGTKSTTVYKFPVRFCSDFHFCVPESEISVSKFKFANGIKMNIDACKTGSGGTAGTTWL